MVEMTENPLVTFVMAIYNQECYIRDSVRAALSQTYEPLEIVFSDDCSTDRTWEIVTEEVNAYRTKGGSHQIILNRNSVNLGIAAHSQKLSSFGSGVLRIGAAGDDISYPDRVESIVNAWKQFPSVSLIVSRCDYISPKGVVDKCEDCDGTVALIDSDPVRVFDRLPCFCGAVMTLVSSKLKGRFGPFAHKCWAEDIVYSMRACLVGDVVLINRPLIQYRTGGGISTTKSKTLEDSIRVNILRNGCYEQILDDVLEVASDNEILLSKVRRRIDVNKAYVTALAAESIFQRVQAAWWYARMGRAPVSMKIVVLILSLLISPLRCLAYRVLYIIR